MTFRSQVGTQFGYSVAVVGDINGDQTGTSPAEVARAQDLVFVEHEGAPSRAFVVFGRDWEAPGTPAVFDFTAGDFDALVETAPGGGEAPGSFDLARATFVSRVGDFNSDGVDDFALNVPYSQQTAEGFPGTLVIVLGGTDFDDVVLQDTSRFGDDALAIWGTGEPSSSARSQASPRWGVAEGRCW